MVGDAKLTLEAFVSNAEITEAETLRPSKISDLVTRTGSGFDFTLHQWRHPINPDSVSKIVDDKGEIRTARLTNLSMEMRLVAEQYPLLNQWQIDPESATFPYGNGTRVTRNFIEPITAKLDPGNTGIGKTTLLRSVSTRLAIDGNATGTSLSQPAPLAGFYPGGAPAAISHEEISSEKAILYASLRQRASGLNQRLGSLRRVASVLIPSSNPTLMPLVTPEQMREIVRNQPPPSSRKETMMEQVRRHHREIAARGVQLPQRKNTGEG
uniref:hypothetical protein n=1 Tax=Prosthecobacter sp. TaxID=1965333 RepID=UPI003783D768